MLSRFRAAPDIVAGEAVFQHGDRRIVVINFQIAGVGKAREELLELHVLAAFFLEFRRDFLQISNHSRFLCVFLLERIVRAERRCEKGDYGRGLDTAEVGKCLHDAQGSDTHIVALRDGGVRYAVDKSIQIALIRFFCAEIELAVIHDLRFFNQRRILIARNIAVSAVTLISRTHHVFKRGVRRIFQQRHDFRQLTVMNEIVEIHSGSVWRLHIIARLEVLHFKDGRGQGVFTVVAVTEIRVAVDDAGQLCGRQIGRKAFKALRDMGFASENIEHRQQLANSAGIDIACRVACVHRADKIVVDGEFEVQIMLLLKLAEHRKLLNDAAVQCFFDRIKGEKQITVQLFHVLRQMAGQHEKHRISAFHVAGASAEQIVAAFKVTACVLRQLSFTERFRQLVAVKGEFLVFTEIIDVYRVYVSMQHDGIPLGAVTALEQRHHVAPVQRVILQILRDNQLRMRLEIGNFPQICFDCIRNITLTGCSVHAGDSDEFLRQLFHLVKHTH